MKFYDLQLDKNHYSIENAQHEDFPMCFDNNSSDELLCYRIYLPRTCLAVFSWNNFNMEGKAKGKAQWQSNDQS